MLTYGPFEPDRPLLVLAHGAGAGENHPWMRGVAAGLAERGLTVVTFEFPYMAARRRLPDRGAVLEQAYSETWALLTDGPAASVRRRFVGGKSMGGRIATQAAAKGLLAPSPSGIVCFGYPLHPPGKPTTRRDAHLPAITCPLLFVHGTRDPFGTPDEMQDVAARIPSSTLHLVEGGDHSLTRAGGRNKGPSGPVGPMGPGPVGSAGPSGPVGRSGRSTTDAAGAAASFDHVLDTVASWVLIDHSV